MNARLACCLFAAWGMASFLCIDKAFGIHNSLLIRERLREANSDPLRIDRRDPHRGVCRDPKATVSPDDFEMKGQWRVEAQVPQEFAEPLREDVTDFLRRMAVEVSDARDHSIRLQIPSRLETMPNVRWRAPSDNRPLPTKVR